RNASDETFVSATLSGSPARASAGSPGAASASEWSWSATLYVQDQSFSAFFSGVDATRTTETPALDQYDVPATAAGAAFALTWGAPEDDTVTTLGLDARHVKGETREAFLYSAPLDTFTRDRRAG